MVSEKWSWKSGVRKVESEKLNRKSGVIKVDSEKWSRKSRVGSWVKKVVSEVGLEVWSKKLSRKS